MESLGGFSSTNGINTCSPMLMAAALVAVRAVCVGRVGLCRCPRKGVAAASESDAYDATK